MSTLKSPREIKVDFLIFPIILVRKEIRGVRKQLFRGGRLLCYLIKNPSVTKRWLSSQMSVSYETAYGSTGYFLSAATTNIGKVSRHEVSCVYVFVASFKGRVTCVPLEVVWKQCTELVYMKRWKDME